MFSKVQIGKSIIPPKSGSLIEAARESPSYFQHLPIYLTLYRQFVDHETRAEIKQTVRKLKVGDLGVKPSTTARSSVKGTTTKLESLLGRYWEYVNWGNDFPRDAWLMDVANVRKAHVYGISRSYSEVPSLKLKDGSKADLSFRRPSICVGKGWVDRKHAARVLQNYGEQAAGGRIETRTRRQQLS
jgi:hypothetical protein